MVDEEPVEVWFHVNPPERICSPSAILSSPTRRGAFPRLGESEAALTADITALALQYGRYRITAMLHQAGWIVNVKRVERIWRREGLKVPQATEARAAVVGRQFVHPASAGISQRRSHPRRAQGPHAFRQCLAPGY